MVKQNKKTDKLAQSNLFDFEPLELKTSVYKSMDNNLTDDKILFSLLALQGVKGIGLKTLKDIYDSELIYDFDNLKSDDKYFKKKYEHIIRQSLFDKIIEQYDYLKESAIKLNEKLLQEKIQFIPNTNKSFPKSLSNMTEPPKWLFIKGDINIINSESIVGIIGTREPSILGNNFSFYLGKEFAKRNFIVLSGFAKGIDSQAHKGAVSYMGQSIAVLGHGFISKYVTTDEKLSYELLSNDGAIITEYFPSEFPSQNSFLRRNEIVACLSKIIIPIELSSIKKSGTASTIRRAMKLNTEVIGIIPEQSNSKSLQYTIESLKKIGCKTFELSTDNDKTFWNFISNQFPNHLVDKNNEARKKRYFKYISDSIKQNHKGILTKNEIVDELIEYLRMSLKE